MKIFSKVLKVSVQRTFQKNYFILFQKPNSQQMTEMNVICYICRTTIWNLDLIWNYISDFEIFGNGETSFHLNRLSKVIHFKKFLISVIKHLILNASSQIDAHSSLCDPLFHRPGAPTSKRQFENRHKLNFDVYENNPNWILGILNFKLEWKGLITDLILLVEMLEICRWSSILIFRLTDVRDIYVQFAYSIFGVCPKQPVRFSIMNSTGFIFYYDGMDPNIQLEIHLFKRNEKIVARWLFFKCNMFPLTDDIENLIYFWKWPSRIRDPKTWIKFKMPKIHLTDKLPGTRIRSSFVEQHSPFGDKPRLSHPR